MTPRFVIPALVTLLVLGAATDARAVGIGVSIPVFEAAGYAPDRGMVSTTRNVSFAVAFPVKKKVAIGFSLDTFTSEFDRDTPGKDIRSALAIPVGFLAEYYPLDGKFNPYFLGHIGPVFLSESAEDDAGAESGGFHVGPHLGFGVGASMRWPVTPLAELRCMAAFTAGEYLDQLYVCGVSAGMAVSF